ncbi:hypothetical protein KIL84_016183 [Mauremys mutica]|uniref:Uncharacterized protein n=1 Tax=Mauremys mutica TaxID=74926 RepID=A0A9D4ASL1_9SAUR|nr:hypothetical protein KIL84_016183 [Mauremys mutica]
MERERYNLKKKKKEGKKPVQFRSACKNTISFFFSAKWYVPTRCELKGSSHYPFLSLIYSKLEGNKVVADFIYSFPVHLVSLFTSKSALLEFIISAKNFGFCLLWYVYTHTQPASMHSGNIFLMC